MQMNLSPQQVAHHKSRFTVTAPKLENGLVPSTRKIIDLQHSRMKRLKHRARHTQTYWTSKKTWLITLTYRPEVEPTKEHWTEARLRFRQWYKKAHGTETEPRILWVRELTKKGRLHYHAVVNGTYPGKWDKIGIWPHGMSQTKQGKGDACSAYLLKYASKLDSKLTGDFKHWRLYGFTGLSQEERRSISYQMLPEWIRSTYSLAEIRSPSARVLHNGQKLCSGWAYGGASFAGRLPRGFDSLVFLGYCVVTPSQPIEERADGGGRESEALPPASGACYS